MSTAINSQVLPNPTFKMVPLSQDDSCVSEQHYSQSPLPRRESAPEASAGGRDSAIKWAEVLPMLLRAAGALTLLISVSAYLFNGIGQGDDLSRYFLLFGHTVALAAIGLGCSRWLKEQKSARLLLLLTLVFISGNFAIIGGFFYHLWHGPVTGLYGAVTWAVANGTGTLLGLSAAALVLVPLVWLGFTIAARRSATVFSALFLLCNSVLLIPSRNEYLIGALLVGLFTLVLVTVIRARAKDVTLATPEGLIARMMLFVPLVILLARNLMHEVGVMMPFAIALACVLTLRHLSLALRARFAGWAALLDLLCFFAAGFLATATTAMLNAFDVLDGIALGLFYAAICSALWFELASRAVKARGFYSVMASLQLAGSFVLAAFFEDSGLVPLVCAIAGLGLLVFGIKTERRVALVLGAVMSVFGLGCYVVDVVLNFNINSWMGFALVGVLAIVLASVIEKRGEKLKQQMHLFKTQLQSWEY